MASIYTVGAVVMMAALLGQVKAGCKLPGLALGDWTMDSNSNKLTLKDRGMVHIGHRTMDLLCVAQQGDFYLMEKRAGVYSPTYIKMVGSKLHIRILGGVTNKDNWAPAAGLGGVTPLSASRVAAPYTFSTCYIPSELQGHWQFAGSTQKISIYGQAVVTKFDNGETDEMECWRQDGDYFLMKIGEFHYIPTFIKRDGNDVQMLSLGARATIDGWKPSGLGGIAPMKLTKETIDFHY